MGPKRARPKSSATVLLLPTVPFDIYLEITNTRISEDQMTYLVENYKVRDIGQ
jgi:hypothetical protein